VNVSTLPYWTGAVVSSGRGCERSRLLQGSPSVREGITYALSHRERNNPLPLLSRLFIPRE